jgi:hypothetical protein
MSLQKTWTKFDLVSPFPCIGADLVFPRGVALFLELNDVMREDTVLGPSLSS